ncbi:PREDICTED: PCNA-associated factor isoform X1 [Nanorana parkeri]|uniref:PCNA-associated factor isoform X1 n=2 Tax=Nanorana parkeri TaxID=125878 RepID=UPI000853FF7C|nr:PREDICTED: PCNA-associated factor isoform X1 [Nanorana parkeri]
MVRTKADSAGTSTGSYRKAVAARAPRKSFGASSSSSNHTTSPTGKKSDGKYAGGNPVCVRPTPKWQKGIGDFFGSPSTGSIEKENCVPSDDDGEEAGGSGVGKAPRKARPLIDDGSDED